mmetsp:Transcript_15837/g.23308  ORF Transcript_15837/g.23308 Transcript_15837/m.23308 type:complete len:193 (-) Transcript_15837:223-801(-)
MDSVSSMLCPAQVIDGIVHRLGGGKLSVECQIISTFAMNNKACPTGSAVKTSLGNEELTQTHDVITHTAPPFFNQKDHHALLKSCYQSAFKLACENVSNNVNGVQKVACPLIGSGARGFPLDVAIDVAASESLKWRDESVEKATEEKSYDDYHATNGNSRQEQMLMFGMMESNVCEALIKAMQDRQNQNDEV